MALLTPKDAAAALNMSVKTLRGHVADGNIRYIVIGRGRKRPNIAFDDSDIAEFKDHQRRRRAPLCLSTRQKTHRSTATTSSSEVVAFMAQLEQLQSAKPKK